MTMPSHRGPPSPGGCSLTKDIVNAPRQRAQFGEFGGNGKTDRRGERGSITCEILGKEECEARGMGAYLGVARGSETEPQFIHLTYKPPSGERSKKSRLCWARDCCSTRGWVQHQNVYGAAAVLGAARAIGSMKPEGVEAHFIVAACE
ncbi:hypothetical protein ACHAW5_008488 [Stephanodiscus triporus]|uniref:Cytosol aminopeptidase domain-containing protein n=1 Tax=Stephanodiscus triporus TaxID=2934178 RepID=A0ABD3MJ15_9STRA